MKVTVPVLLPTAISWTSTSGNLDRNHAALIATGSNATCAPCGASRVSRLSVEPMCAPTSTQFDVGVMSLRMQRSVRPSSRWISQRPGWRITGISPAACWAALATPSRGVRTN